MHFTGAPEQEQDAVAGGNVSSRAEWYMQHDDCLLCFLECTKKLWVGSVPVHSGRKKRLSHYTHSNKPTLGVNDVAVRSHMYWCLEGPGSHTQSSSLKKNYVWFVCLFIKKQVYIHIRAADQCFFNDHESYQDSP